MSTKVEGRVRQGVVGTRRTSCKIARGGRKDHGPCSRPSNGGATAASAASACTGANLNFSSTVAHQCQRVPQRRGHRVDVGSADGHPRGDCERQCGRGGQIVEFGGPSSDEYATTPTFHGGAICPCAREFIWSG